MLYTLEVDHVLDWQILKRVFKFSNDNDGACCT